MKGYALKKWESTLNPCVHAHGPDVELIVEAARKNNYPPCYKFILYPWFDHFDRGFRPCSPLNTISWTS